jgi:hypothetical protein
MEASISSIDGSRILASNFDSDVFDSGVFAVCAMRQSPLG